MYNRYRSGIYIYYTKHIIWYICITLDIYEDNDNMNNNKIMQKKKKKICAKYAFQ